MSAKLLRVSADGEACYRLTWEEDGVRHLARIDERCFLSLGPVRAGDRLSDEQLSLVAEGEIALRALSHALRLLAFGDNSARALTRKLREKGHPREAAEAAVAQMIERGYLCEQAQAARFAARAVRQKHWGRRRVLAALVQKGYAPALARRAIETAEADGEVDFAAARSALLEEKLPADATVEERRALLYRYGY